jgi:hypothetical protein
MDTSKDWRPRLSIELSDAQLARLRRSIAWGLRTKVLSKIIDDLLNLIDKHGQQVVLGAFLSGELTIEEITPELVGGKNDTKRTSDPND